MLRLSHLCRAQDAVANIADRSYLRPGGGLLAVECVPLFSWLSCRRSMQNKLVHSAIRRRITFSLTETPAYHSHSNPSNICYLSKNASFHYRGYHAGAVRTMLLQNASTIVQPFGVSVSKICAVRSCIRARNPWT